MPLIQAQYPDIRSRMRAGDLVAFGGKGRLSGTIKFFTQAPVSHVGAVLRSKPMVNGATADIGNGGHLVELIESTSLDGYAGVVRTRLSDRIARYGGEIWWLPLSEAVRVHMNERTFVEFALAQEGKPYDAVQAALSGIDWFDKGEGWSFARENFALWYCSELVTASFEAAGALPTINASEVTPIDLCRLAIWAPDYYQLAGKPKAIRGYNAIEPERWIEEQPR